MFPDILRSVITDVMICVLLYHIALPKYGVRLYILVAVGVVLVNVLANVFYYLRGDYASVVRVDFIMLLLICVLGKPLFRETVMQWLFSFVTVMNIYAVVVFLSYTLSGYLPWPLYANTLIRLLMFLGLALVFGKIVRPIYRKVMQHWPVFFLLVLGVAVNLGYYFFGADIRMQFQQNAAPILLLVLLAAVIYLSIFVFMRTITSAYELREEAIRVRAVQAVLASELDAQADAQAITQQNRHDIRHHNNLLLEWLQSGDVAGAIAYLHASNDGNERVSQAGRVFCKNATANAVCRIFSRRAEEIGATLDVRADVPATLSIGDVELGAMLSNLLENACEATVQAQGSDRTIQFDCKVAKGRLMIETRNPCAGQVVFEEGLPVSTKPGGGIGTRSLREIVKRHGGMLDLRQDGAAFVARVMLPQREARNAFSTTYPTQEERPC